MNKKLTASSLFHSAFLSSKQMVVKKIAPSRLPFANFQLLIAYCLLLIAYCLLLIAYCLLPIISFSQDSTVIAPRKNYTVREDGKISELLSKYKDYNSKREFTNGYRIQIMYTDVRDEVYQSKGTMYKEFPDLASYVEYEQPYYKLRLGDFKTRLEATHILQQVTALYSGAFIVHDKVKLN